MIINNKISDGCVHFSDLPVGAWYLYEGYLCRKIVPDADGNECSCIDTLSNFNDGQAPDDLVLRVDVEINIIPYKG